MNEATLCILAFASMFIVEETHAFTANNWIILPFNGSFATARTSASVSSFDPPGIDSLGVSAILEEEGTIVDSDNRVCARPTGGSVSCAVEATDTSISEDCEYCASGAAIALDGTNAIFNNVLPRKCKTYEPVTVIVP